MKSYSDKRPADFAVRYRFLTAEEGGRKNAPQQHFRFGFLYAGDDPQRDGGWMIWPEFLDKSGRPLPAGPVPSQGMAHMFILDLDLRSVHRERIRIGTKGYMIEGATKVSECEVTEILALAGAHGR